MFQREDYWVSIDSDVEEPEVIPWDFDERSSSEEEEAANEWRDNFGSQEIEKDTGVIVRVIKPQEGEKGKYLDFDKLKEDWEFSGAPEDDPPGKSSIAVEVPRLSAAQKSQYLTVECSDDSV
jgi:hypothetical protein